MSSKYRRYIKKLTDKELVLAIASAQNSVELGERRIMDLELAADVDEGELKSNYTLLRVMNAHLKMLNMEQRRRENE